MNDNNIDINKMYQNLFYLINMDYNKIINGYFYNRDNMIYIFIMLI